MTMEMMEMGQQMYLLALERSLRIIRSTERLSLEASIEELCKVQLLKLIVGPNSRQLPRILANESEQTNEGIKVLYHSLFESNNSSYAFKGWEQTSLSYYTFIKVLEELTEENLFSGDNQEESRVKAEGEAFIGFLQLHYSGYLSKYSSPKLLNDFIVKVLDLERRESFADPCCGIGGLLLEAVKQTAGRIRLKGFDVNQRMVNTANLQLMMYGYNDLAVGCHNILETPVVFMEGPFEAVATHLPQIQRFSIAGNRNALVNTFPRAQEDIFISQIVKMLKHNGIAALVVSDDLLISESRKNSRTWLKETVQILNITRFEGVSYTDSSVRHAYNVIVLKKSRSVVNDVCVATLIKDDVSEGEVWKTAYELGSMIRGESPYLPQGSKYFKYQDENTWNVNLLFSREIMGTKYPTCQLRDILVHERQLVKIDDTENYKQLTVRNRGLGVVDRKDEYKGANSSNNTRFIARTGQIIVSSLEANKGAIGVVPKELDGALVSSNYYLFDIIDPIVDPDYLVMVLSSKPVSKQLDYFVGGSVMPRISIRKFLSLVIPLPDLETQKRLVASLKRKVKKALEIQDELEKEQNEFSMRLFGYA